MVIHLLLYAGGFVVFCEAFSESARLIDAIPSTSLSKVLCCSCRFKFRNNDLPAIDVSLVICIGILSASEL